MFVGIFGGGVSRGGAFVCGKNAGDSHQRASLGSVRGAYGRRRQIAQLWGGMAFVLGGTDVQPAFVGWTGGVLARVSFCKVAFLRFAFVGAFESVAHSKL